MQYLKFPGDLENGIQVDLNTPDEQLSAFEGSPGQARKPDVIVLRSRNRDRWHSEFINPHSWYELPLGAKPTSIVVFKNESGQPCGIVHMRNLDNQRSVCISLLSKFGAWQTGIWLEIDSGDKLAISWFRDWHNTEISAINLEIISATHEEPPGNDDELIPLGDEIDVELYAAEALLEAATPHADLIAPRTDELKPAPSLEPVAEAVPAEAEIVPLDPGANIIICTKGEEGHSLKLDSSPWFKYQITNTPIPVVNLVTDHQQLAGKIYIRKLSDWFEYSLSAIIGNEEYLTGSWNPINPDSSLSLIWATDRSGKVLEEFHIELNSEAK